MRWTQKRWVRDELARRRTAQMRTAKSCGSGIRCWCQAGRGFASRTGFRWTANLSATVTKRNSSPGRARRKPLKPLRGESRVTSGATVVTTVCYLPMHTGCGCSGHPAFPAPSVREGRHLGKPRALPARRDRGLVPGRNAGGRGQSGL